MSTLRAVRALALVISAAALTGPSLHGADAPPAKNDVVVGQVRVQVLSDTLVRLEQKGAKGFEDRITFTVVGRDWPGVVPKVEKKDNATVVTAPRFRVVIPADGQTLTGVKVESLQGETLFEYPKAPPPAPAAPGKPAPSAAVGAPTAAYLPDPGKMPLAWAIADSPRIIPPEWGATPAPDAQATDPASGWDLANQAPDVYVFVPGEGAYTRLRADFLKLTGPTPLPPLYTFGHMDSRYHPYSEQTALETIDTYRKKQIPLDVFVVDTDWRVGASHGYGVNTKLFPDMEGFIKKAHERHVRLMFNDHPEPQAPTALDPKELRYRYDGLTSVLKMGMDFWWYDRNWGTKLREPAPGLAKEVWGMRLYRDTTLRLRPDERPLIMSNVQGINNGRRAGPSLPAAHRFPIWWTGDTGSTFGALQNGVANGVDWGLLCLHPYVNEDLGGHTGNPPPELYVRFLQYGAFCPVMRVHCTRGRIRYPWAFGEEAEKIVSEYIRLRYRLLPLIYAAARGAYEDGTPVLRRCDLMWPAEADASGNQQYLFGEDLLVAPISVAATAQEGAPRTVWIPPGNWRDVWTGANVKGPQKTEVHSPLWHTPLYVREGGVVLSVPQVQYADEKPWTNVVADVFVPSEPAATVRTLYEDDGHSQAYLRGAACKTSVTFEKNAAGLRLHIGPIQGAYDGMVKQRSWTLRLHCPKGLTPGEAKLTKGGGKEAAIRHIPPAKSGDQMPFRGAGSADGPEGGTVVEVVVPMQSTAQQIELVAP